MRNEDGRKNNRKRKCRQKMSAALLVLLLGFTGCGRADMGQIEEDISEASIGTATDADAAMGISMGEIPEHITYEKINDSNGNYIKVDADVIVPDVTSYSVYEEKKIEIDDDYLKTLAGNLFDNGEYEQIKPAWMCTQEELGTERAYIENLVDRYKTEDDIESSSLPRWLYNLCYFYNDRNYDGSKVSELSEGKLIYGYTESYNVSGETFTEGYNNCTLRGNVDGKEWILYYENYIPDEVFSSTTQDDPVVSTLEEGTLYKVVLASAEPKYVGWINMSSQDNYLDVNKYGENISDEEQCRQMVYDFAEKLGLFDNMEIAYVNDLIVTDAEGNSRLDGYRMYMVPAINGVQNYFSNMSGLNTQDLDSMIAHQEYIAFDVSYEGVSNVFIGEQYELGECLTQQANMLSFEQIDMSAQAYMQGLIDTSAEEQAYYETIDRIQLAYATVKYDEGYTIVPVWMYYLKYDKEYLYHQAYFGINALDGSVVGVVSGNYAYMFYLGGG